MEVSLYILFPILLGEELLEDDDCFFDRLDHTGFFNEIGVVDEVGEQGDHDGADEEPLEPAHGRPGEVVDPVGIGHLEKRMEGAGDHADDEHHHAEDQHIGDDVDPLGRRILGKDAAQLAIIAPGEPDAAEDAHKPRHFVEKAAQRAAQGEQGDDRKQHDIQYIQVVRKRHRKKGLRVFPLRGRYGKRCNPADHSVIMRNTL